MIMIFDTETTSTNKPFCYNVGYTIVDETSGETVKKADYVIEQIWHNIPLFSTAYYENKRPIYVSAMRSKKAILEKWGYVCKKMAKDIKEFNVTGAYAYNSPFDDNVFTFNCDYFKNINPFETTPIFDIRGYANNFITNTPEYKKFCDDYSRYTESGNYSATAETVYQYLTNNPDFVENHTALSDSEIETEILLYCIRNGAEINKEYKVTKIIPRNVTKKLIIKKNKEVIFETEYTKSINKKDTIYLS